MIYGFGNKKTRLLWWPPIYTSHAAVVRQELLWLGPCSEMRLVIQEKNFSVSDASCYTESVFMRTKLNAIDTCFSLVPKDATPLLLGNLFPHFDLTVIAAGGN